MKKKKNAQQTEKRLLDLYISFFKIGILTFGGGLAMLPMLKKELVEHRQWITEEEILDMYAIGQCTPGVIAVNTATFVGFRKAGIPGGIFATLGIVSPSLLIICLIASILKNFMHLPAVLHALSGIRITVCALMIQTVISMVQKGVRNKLGVFIFLSGFLLASFTPVPLALIVIGSALTGIFAQWKEAKNL